MKVKCKKLLNSFGESVNASPWLTVGEIYHVVSIFIDRCGYKNYGVISSKNIDDANLSCHLSECFDIVSTRIPTSWSPWVTEDSSIGISPKAWQVDGFMEMVLEGEELSLNIFKKECDLIISEDA